MCSIVFLGIAGLVNLPRGMSLPAPRIARAQSINGNPAPPGGSKETQWRKTDSLLSRKLRQVARETMVAHGERHTIGQP